MSRSTPTGTAAPVLMNDFKRQWADTAVHVLEAVRAVGASGWYILGEEVLAFEEELARLWRRRHAVGCGNGLDGIEIALRALGLRPGEKVLTTPLSAFATTLAILRAGGVPVFVDVDRHGLIDLDECRDLLARDRSVRTMVPVHLYGHALDLDALADLKRKFELRIVEDCAQAIGACWGDRPAGSVGDLAVVSFYPTKNLGALGDGGAIATDDAAFAEACRVLRDYGQGDKYVHVRLGLNSRLDELHAAILRRAFLPRLAGWTERRRAIAARYREGIRNDAAAAYPVPARSQSVWHLFPVSVPAERREAFRDHLHGRGIVTSVHYPRIIPAQPAMEGRPFETAGDLPHARAAAGGEVSLPIHPYLGEEEIDRVIEHVNGWPPS